MKISLKQKLIKREQAKFYNNVEQISAIYTPYQNNLNAQIGNDWALECYQETETEAEIEKGIGILEIEGHIGSDGWFGGVEADDVKNGLEQLKESGCSHIILKISSGGGCVNEEAEINQIIENFKQENPERKIVSFIDKVCASSAYSIACNTPKIYSNSIPSNVVIGSIGSLAQRIDLTSKNEKDKVEVNIIASGEKKAWGDPNFPFSEDEKKYWEQRILETSTKLFNRVSQARNIPVETIKSWEAGVFNNNEALANGLIDGILTLDELITKLKSDILNNVNLQNPFNDMSKELIDENVALKIQVKNLQDQLSKLENQLSTNPLQEENKKLQTQLQNVLNAKKEEAICAYQAFSGQQLDDKNEIVATINSLSSLEELDTTIKKYQTLLNSVHFKPVQAVAELPKETELTEAQKLDKEVTQEFKKSRGGIA